MKIFASLLLILLTAACHAEKGQSNTCTITRESLKLATPKGIDIDQTFWQKTTDGGEQIDRLQVTFKDGSIAVVEHKYCLMYNYEVAFYTKDKAKFEDIEKLRSTLKSLFDYSAIQDKSIAAAITAMTDRFKEKGYSATDAMTTGYDSSTENNQKVEFILGYQPLEDSSIHNAAILVYMGIGGAD